jgi:hypothetical protein
MGDNKFIGFTAIPAGAQVGPRLAADLWTLVPSTGLDAGLNAMCSGDFVGTIAIEGSLDGTNFSPVGAFTRGPGTERTSELAPVIVDEVVRYVRPAIMPGTIVFADTFVTLGGTENCDCSGEFPGFGLTTLPIGNDSVGIAATAARSSHSHSWLRVADQTALDALDASAMVGGQRVWVDVYKDSFTLQASTQAVAADVRRTALNKAGYLWIRDGFSPGWWSELVWYLTSSALANNQASGTAANAPISPQEWRRRTRGRWLPGTETSSVTLNLVADLGDNDYIQADWSVGLRGGAQTITIQGVQTVVATGLITASTPVNRATNTPAAITAGFSWASHVGRLVRLQGTTTTTAWCVKNNGANSGRMGEQSVAGVLGGGFTNGQTVEVVTLTKVPGIHVRGTSQVIISDCSFDPAAVPNLRMDPIFGGFAANRCQFRGNGTATAGISVSTITLSGCAFVDRAWQLNGIAALVLSCQINQGSGTGLQLFGGRVAENTLQSHFMQASSITIAERTYVHVSGGGSANLGMFDLAAGQVGIALAFGAHYDAGAMWGSGNDATSVYVSTEAGCVLTSMNPAGYTVTGGAGFVINGQFTIPVAQLQSSIGPGQQPVVMSLFSFTSGDAGGVTSGYLNYSSGGLAAQPQRWPISGRTIMRLWLAAPVGTGSAAPTVTLYKSAGGTGAATPTAMTTTLAASQPAGTNNSDSSHPILFASGDGFDVFSTQPITAEGAAPFVCVVEALA